MIEVSALGGYGEKFSVELAEYFDSPMYNVELDMQGIDFVDHVFLADIKRVIDIATSNWDPIVQAREEA